jgi:hypothetical protein
MTTATNSYSARPDGHRIAQCVLHNGIGEEVTGRQRAFSSALKRHRGADVRPHFNSPSKSQLAAQLIIVPLLFVWLFMFAKCALCFSICCVSAARLG